MKRNVRPALAVLAACILGPLVGGCQNCLGGNDTPPPPAVQPPAPTVSVPRQLRAPMMNTRTADVDAADAGS